MPLRVEFSPYAYEFHEDPYPLYQRLRDEAPVYGNSDVDLWALSRHADVLADFAGKLPMDVISETLGVPEADPADLRSRRQAGPC